MTLVFNFSMQELLGMINTLQIIAYMPLNNIPLPGNCYHMFDVIIGIVSFDFFPMHEYFDFNFTPTEPWSNSFEWLDYDSLNFFELMGSATLLFIVLGIQILLTSVFWILESVFEIKIWFRGASERFETE